MANRNFGSKADPSNPVLAATAIRAMTDSSFTKTKRECQKLVRQVVQRAVGSKYDRFHKGTAELSRRAWIAGGYDVSPANGSVVGDILYKKGDASEPAGHVGIRVPGNRVAENSSTSIGRVSGAKGYRTLAQFGKVDTIVRLPRIK